MSAAIKKKMLRWAVLLLLIATLAAAVKTSWENRARKPGAETVLWTLVRPGIEQQMSLSLMPLLAFLANREAAAGFPELLKNVLKKQMPIYYFSEQHNSEYPETEDPLTRELLLKQEGADEANKNIPESELDYNETALHIEEGIMQALLEENVPPDTGDTAGRDTAAGLFPGNVTENTAAPALPFKAPAYPVYTYDWSEGFSFDDLIANFYAIDSITDVTDSKINLENLLYHDLKIEKNGKGPQILIYHTHSQEAFADSVPGDEATTIVGAGGRLAAILREQYGFGVLHHTGEYDVESRDYAYSNALPVIERLLAETPSIQVVIDLHRDEMNGGRKLLMELQGRPTARFMFFNGLSYTRRTGKIDYLENVNLNDNLAFSFQAQVAANEYYPGLARKIYLRAYRYNMHLMPRYTLVELGAQTNTVEEIMNACDPLAHVIATVLQGENILP